MNLNGLTARLRDLVRPSKSRIDPHADDEDLAPLAEDAPPTSAPGIDPAAGEARQGTSSP